jgi:hypothetical protein
MIPDSIAIVSLMANVFIIGHWVYKKRVRAMGKRDFNGRFNIQL